MSNQIDELSLVLCKGPHGNRVTVSLESFLEFNADIDHELSALVDLWSDYVTANSDRLGDVDSRS